MWRYKLPGFSLYYHDSCFVCIIHSVATSFDKTCKLLYGNKYLVAWAVLVASVVLSVFVRFPTGFYDESVHYIRSQGIASGQLLGYSKDGDRSKIGHDINSVDLEFINGYYHGDRSRPISTDWLSSPGGADKGSDVYTINTSAAPYTPVPYIAHALAAKLASLINVSSGVEFVMMRIGGALLSLGIIFVAFKISPRKYKWTVLAIALIPMSIASFAAISTDGLTIASSLLFMAVLLAMIEKVRSKDLATKDLALLATSSLLLVGVKMPAFLMIALVLAFLIIFWKKIGRRHRIYLLATIFITATLTLWWAFYAKDINTGAYWGRNTDTLEQLKFIIAQPLMFARNLSYAILNYDYLGMVYNNYANNPRFAALPFLVNVIVMIGLALSSFVDRDYKKATIDKVRFYWSQVLLFGAVIGAIFVLLYLQFNPVGTPNEIAGVQPRYLIPFIGLLLMTPYTMRLSRSWRAFACVAPFVGVAVYLCFIIIQLSSVSV